MARDLAYFIQGDAGPGPGVLLLHSLWGLTSAVKGMADDIADEGYTVLAPDINFGELPETEQAAIVGRLVAERALAAGVTKVVFDRGGFKYHGRVKALAEAAREAGLNF